MPNKVYVVGVGMTKFEARRSAQSGRLALGLSGYGPRVRFRSAGRCRD